MVIMITIIVIWIITIHAEYPAVDDGHGGGVGGGGEALQQQDHLVGASFRQVCLNNLGLVLEDGTAAKKITCFFMGFKNCWFVQLDISTMNQVWSLEDDGGLQCMDNYEIGE